MVRLSEEKGLADQARLNPCALPSNTTWRFALLVVAVLTSSLFVFSILYLSLPSTGTRYEQAYIRCPAAAVRGVPDSASALDKEKVRVGALAECRRPFDVRQAVAVLLAVLVLLLVALALFGLTPRWKIRRRRLVPLEQDAASDFYRSFEKLCREANLPRRPLLLWNPLAARGDALAFGRPGRSYVAVGAGLVAQFYSDPAATTTVLRHELGHVVNRDVERTYFALSLWHAFVLVGLLPLLLVDLLLGEGLVSSNLWRAGVLAVLVYAVLNSVLRAREYYADAWAASSPAARTVLARILGAPGRRPRPVSRLWRVHPDPSSRLRVLDDSAELFRLRLSDALGAGVFAGFAFPTLKYFLFLVVPFSLTLYVGAAAGVVSASLLGAVIGSAAWRAGLAARVRDRPLAWAAPFGATAALAFVGGYHLSFTAGTLSTGAVAFLVLFTVLSLHWLVATADAWFDAAPSTRSGTLFAWAGPVAAAFGVWGTGWFSVLDVAARARGSPHPFDLANVVADHSFTPFLVMSLVLFPLAACLLRRRVSTTTTPGWVLPDAEQDRMAWTLRPPLAVASALRWGTLGGGVFCLAIVVLDAAGVSPRVLLISADEAAFEYAPGQHHAEIALAVVAQAVVAALLALRAKRLPVLHALFALPASATLMMVGVIAPDVIAGEGLPPDAAATARLVFAGGAFAALALGATIYALRRLAYRILEYRQQPPRLVSHVELDGRASSSGERGVR